MLKTLHLLGLHDFLASSRLRGCVCRAVRASEDGRASPRDLRARNRRLADYRGKTARVMSRGEKVERGKGEAQQGAGTASWAPTG